MKSLNLLYKKLSVNQVTLLSMIVVFLIGLVGLTKWGVWFDESFTIRLIQFDIADIISRTASDVHPPLYYIALKGWAAIGGYGLYWLRLFGVVMLVISTFIWSRVAKKLLSVDSAKIGIALLAIGPFSIRYAQEIRMYTFASIFVALSTLYFLKIRSNPNKKLNYPIYALGILASLYTHYFSVLFLAPHIIVFILDIQKAGFKQWFSRYKYLFLSALLVIAGYLPWIPKLIDQTTRVSGGFWVPSISPATALNMFTRYALNTDPSQFKDLNGSVFGFIFLVFSLVLFVGFGWLLRHLYKNKDRRTLFLLGTAIIPPVIVFCISLPPLTPVFVSRYFAYFAPAFYLGTGSLILSQKLMPKKVLAAIVVFVFGIGLINNLAVGNYNWHTKSHSDTKPLIDVLEDKVDPNTDVVFVRGAEEYLNTLYYYQTENKFSYYAPVYAQTFEWFNTDFPILKDNGALTANEISDLPSRYKDIWVIYHINNPPDFSLTNPETEVFYHNNLALVKVSVL